MFAQLIVIFFCFFPNVFQWGADIIKITSLYKDFKEHGFPKKTIKFYGFVVRDVAIGVMVSKQEKELLIESSSGEKNG
jgi:uncharacterized membrane protein